MQLELRAENRRLLGERPDCWIPILIIDRLERPLDELLARLDALKAAPASPSISVSDSWEFFQTKKQELKSAIARLQEAIEVGLQSACHKRDWPNGPALVTEACSNVLCQWLSVADLELEVLGRTLHPKCSDAQRHVAGFTKENLAPFRDFIRDLRQAVEANRRCVMRFAREFSLDRLEPRSAKTSLRRGQVKATDKRWGCFTWVCFILLLWGLAAAGVPGVALGFLFLYVLLTR